MRAPGAGIAALVGCGVLAGCGDHSSPPHLVSLPPGGSSLPVHGPQSVDGSPEMNRYGTVEVKIAIGVGGRLTTVAPLLLPSHRSRSRSLSAMSAPILAREAVQAQGARIDTVSGATYTSESYARSLQSAIDRAAAGSPATAARAKP